MISTLKKKLSKKGFTLAELLIVVAIIAVLVAIAIPTFSAQLEKARQATDLANLRSSYSEAVANHLANASVDAVGSDYKMQNTSNKLDQIDLSNLPSELGAKLTSTTVLTHGNEYHIKITSAGVVSIESKVTTP